MFFTQNVSTAHDYFCGNDARVPMVESQWPIVQLVSGGLYRFKTYVEIRHICFDAKFG